MSRLRRALAASVVLLLVVPAGASAHARLESTVPEAGAVLQRQPERVVFSFSEPVEANFAIIRVFDPTGAEVQAGAPSQPPGRNNVLEVALRPNLLQGTYSATYRLVSADSYPVSGGFAFSIGAPSSRAELPSTPAGAGRAVSLAQWAVRLLGLATIGIAVGALFFLIQAWRPALAERKGGVDERWEQAAVAFDRRLRLLVGGAIAVGLTVTLVALPLQAASAAGTSIWGALDGELLGEIVDTRFGSLMLVRAAAWFVLGAILVVAARRSRGPVLDRRASPELVALVMLPIGSLLVSPALAGHARTQDPQVLLFPADVAHVAAMSLWLGGLAALAVAVPAAVRPLEQPERRSLLNGVLLRFSGAALASVAVLIVSGTVQAVFEVGSVSALFETGYGRSVLAKIVLLGALVCLGAVNRRRLIPALTAAAAQPQRIWGSIRRNVRVEVALIGIVLAVTAVLVGFAPPNETSSVAAAPEGRVSGRTTIGDVTLRYTVDPARVGLNQLNLYLLQPDGRPFRGAKRMRVELLKLPDEGGVPQTVPLQRPGPGHYTNTATQFDAAGRWSMRVQATGTSSSPSDEAEIQIAIG